jgi:hypothetical protein
VKPAAGATPLTSYPINSAMSAAIGQALATDALGYCYSGIVSIADGLRGFESSFFTWATVKLYYATFYLARSLLALRGYAIFYVGKTPYRLLARAGETSKKQAGTTHQVVLRAFESLALFPALLTQTIGGDKPMNWLEERRVQANYAQPRFDEPAVPAHLAKITTVGARKAMEGYLADDLMLYAFDQDHAILAYPVELLKALLGEIDSLSATVTLLDVDRTFLGGLFKDAKGKIACVGRLLENS